MITYFDIEAFLAAQHGLSESERVEALSNWLVENPNVDIIEEHDEICLGMHEGLQSVWAGKQPPIRWVADMVADGLIESDGSGGWDLTKRGEDELAEPMWRCFACGRWWTADERHPLAAVCMTCRRDGVLAWSMPGSEVSDAG